MRKANNNPKFTEPYLGEFYSIVDYKGVKHVEILGFNWYDDGRYHFTETRHYGVPLKEFIKNYKKRAMDYVYAIEEDSRQTQYDLSKRDALVYYTRKAFNGEPPMAIIPFEDITEETPCGHYVA